MTVFIWQRLMSNNFFFQTVRSLAWYVQKYSKKRAATISSSSHLLFWWCPHYISISKEELNTFQIWKEYFSIYLIPECFLCPAYIYRICTELLGWSLVVWKLCHVLSYRTFKLFFVIKCKTLLKSFLLKMFDSVDISVVFVIVFWRYCRPNEFPVL